MLYSNSFLSDSLTFFTFSNCTLRLMIIFYDSSIVLLRPLACFFTLPNMTSNVSTFLLSTLRSFRVLISSLSRSTSLSSSSSYSYASGDSFWLSFSLNFTLPVSFSLSLLLPFLSRAIFLWGEIFIEAFLFTLLLLSSLILLYFPRSLFFTIIIWTFCTIETLQGNLNFALVGYPLQFSHKIFDFFILHFTTAAIGIFIRLLFFSLPS